MSRERCLCTSFLFFQISSAFDSLCYWSGYKSHDSRLKGNKNQLILDPLWVIMAQKPRFWLLQIACSNMKAVSWSFIVLQNKNIIYSIKSLHQDEGGFSIDLRCSLITLWAFWLVVWVEHGCVRGHVTQFLSLEHCQVIDSHLYCWLLLF